MAFSSETKTELARIIPNARCCRMAELSAFYDFNGYLFGEKGSYLDFNSSQPKVARKIITLVRSLFEVPTQILVKRARLPKHQICTVRVLTVRHANMVYGALQRQSFLAGERRVLRRTCCQRAYVRGAFLTHGSVTNPERTYHLEITTEKTEVAARVLSTINALGLTARMTTRKGNLLVYLKNGEQIVMLLNLMGAHQALLQLENVRVLKEMRNQVNRLVNCETANVDKTVAAALAQLDDIGVIEARIGLHSLSPKLQTVAKLRRDNPYASLQELGSMVVPPMSKSGINYRLKQLRTIREELTMN